MQFGCALVASLLHYLFLCAFYWMLCEGIMLYLLLRVVFSEMSKKWWPFVLIGYCKLRLSIAIMDFKLGYNCIIIINYAYEQLCMQ